MPFGFWYIFQDDMIACEPPQVVTISVTFLDILFETPFYMSIVLLSTYSNTFFVISVSAMWSDIWSNIPNACRLIASKGNV